MPFYIIDPLALCNRHDYFVSILDNSFICIYHDPLYMNNDVETKNIYVSVYWINVIAFLYFITLYLILLSLSLFLGLGCLLCTWSPACNNEYISYLITSSIESCFKRSFQFHLVSFGVHSCNTVYLVVGNIERKSYKKWRESRSAHPCFLPPPTPAHIVSLLQLDLLFIYLIVVGIEIANIFESPE